MGLNHYPNLTRGEIVYDRVAEVDDIRVIVEIEALAEPVKRGASWRTHRLWQNGQLASGHSYQTSLEAAILDARYIEEITIYRRLKYQNMRVAKLMARIAHYEINRDKIKALAEQMDDLFTHYPPVTFVEHRGQDVESCAMCDKIGGHDQEMCPTVKIREIRALLEELQ